MREMHFYTPRCNSCPQNYTRRIGAIEDKQSALLRLENVLIFLIPIQA